MAPRRLLLIYSTTDGQTLRIAERLRAVAEAAGATMRLVPVESARADDLAGADVLAIGARIRYGRHADAVIRFVEANRAALEGRPSAFFSVNVVARKPGKNTAETNPYVREFLQRTGWRPTLAGVFAGRIDYRRYGWRDRQIIRFIMWMTKGPTAPDACVEFTDWDAVEAFGRRLAALR